MAHLSGIAYGLWALRNGVPGELAVLLTSAVSALVCVMALVWLIARSLACDHVDADVDMVVTTYTRRVALRVAGTLAALLAGVWLWVPGQLTTATCAGAGTLVFTWWAALRHIEQKARLAGTWTLTVLGLDGRPAYKRPV